MTISLVNGVNPLQTTLLELGIVSGRVALLLRSAEIQPVFGRFVTEWHSPFTPHTPWSKFATGRPDVTTAGCAQGKCKCVFPRKRGWQLDKLFHYSWPTSKVGRVCVRVDCYRAGQETGREVISPQRFSVSGTNRIGHECLPRTNRDIVS